MTAWRLIPSGPPWLQVLGLMVMACTVFNQWRKKMFLNRGAVNKIARKARKNFFGSHDTPSNHAHYYANLAVK